MDPTFLAHKNPHPRDDKITFYAPTHTYTAAGISTYTSVTTWVHNHFPKFNADKIIDKMMASKKWTRSKYFGQTKEEIKTLWNNNGLTASTAGTKLHDDIEWFLNQSPRENNSIEYQYFLNFFNQRPDLVPYRTEWRVWHEDWKFAGAIDFVSINSDGSLTIWDWKRCKEIKKSNMFECATTDCISYIPNSNFWLYSLQLNTYKAILEDKYDKQIKDMYLICLHPNHTDYQCFKVPHLQEEMRNLLERRKKLIK